MKGVKYISWADTTGYSVTAQAYIKLLVRNGINNLLDTNDPWFRWLSGKH